MAKIHLPENFDEYGVCSTPFSVKAFDLPFAVC